MEKLFLSFDQVESQIGEIQRQLHAQQWQPDVVVGVTRGGLVPAVMLSHAYDVKMVCLDISLRDKKLVESRGFDQTHDFVSKGSKVLVVDDINDSGNTIATVRAVLQGVDPNLVKIAVLAHNHTSHQSVDACGFNINKQTQPQWIVYPWEKN
jgi:hypoxanthine phosphoribosyltransferase